MQKNNNNKRNKKGNSDFDFRTALSEDLETIFKLDYDVLDSLRDNFLSKLLGFQEECVLTQRGYDYKEIFKPVSTTLFIIEYIIDIMNCEDKEKIRKVTDNTELVYRILYSAKFLFKKEEIIDKITYNKVLKLKSILELLYFEEDEKEEKKHLTIDFKDFEAIFGLNSGVLRHTILSKLLGFQGECVYTTPDYDDIFKPTSTTSFVIKYIIHIMGCKEKICKLMNNTELVDRIIYSANFLFGQGKITEKEYSNLISALDPEFLTFRLDGSDGKNENSEKELSSAFEKIYKILNKKERFYVKSGSNSGKNEMIPELDGNYKKSENERCH